MYFIVVIRQRPSTVCGDFFPSFFLRPSFLDLAGCIKEISVVRLCILDLLFRIPVFRRKKCKIQSLTQEPEVDLTVAAEYEIPVEEGVKRLSVIIRDSRQVIVKIVTVILSTTTSNTLCLLQVFVA